MSSRIFVKNLPLKLTEEEFAKHFSELSPFTDIRLLYNKNGGFRRVGIIGFKTDEQAKEAIKKFNNSYIKTSKISVTEFVPLTSESRPRPWSKYSEGSSAYLKLNEKSILKRKSEMPKNESKRKKLVDELIGDIKDDTQFKEFMKECQNLNTVPWADSVQPLNSDETKQVETSSKADVEKSNKQAQYIISLEGKADFMNGKKLQEVTHCLMELQKKSSAVANNKSMKAEVFACLNPRSVDDIVLKLKNSGIKVCSIEKVTPTKKTRKNIRNAEKSVPEVIFELKLRGLPFRAKEKDVKSFFLPINVRKVKIIRDKKGCNKGLALVHFDSEKDLNSALSKNKCFLFGRYVELFRTKRSGKIKDFKTYEQTDAKNEAAEVEVKAEQGVDENVEPISDSGCLFIKNIWHECTEDELREWLSSFGPIADLTLPVSRFTKKNKGFAIVVYTFPQHAVEAFNKLNNSIFQGRIIRIEPGKYKSDDAETNDDSTVNKKKTLSHSDNWNSLFVGVDVVADKLVEEYGVDKEQIFLENENTSLPVKLAIAESKFVTATRNFLEENGVRLDCFGQPDLPRSDRVLIAKNLPVGTTADELNEMFSEYGAISRLIFPPKSAAAIIEFERASDAKGALKALNYTCFRDHVFYLEWAPINSLNAPTNTEVKQTNVSQSQTENKNGSDESSSDSDDEGCCLYVKNLNFSTTEPVLKNCSATIAVKKDVNRNALLSMGYGFVKFKHREDAKNALKTMQNCMLDGHKLTLQLSDRKTVSTKGVKRKKQVETKQNSSKICVRNVPFQVNASEIRELFEVFGELKSVRLPKKATGGHRGFAFVDFVSKNNAKKAFKALCQSTHLFGRRLVLEWAKDDSTEVDELRQKTARYFEVVPSVGKKDKKSTFVSQLKEITQSHSSEE